MRNIFLDIGILVLSLIIFSCSTLKEKHIKTANKVVELLYSEKTQELHDMIVINADNTGLDNEQIKWTSKQFKYVINKYGLPKDSNFQYIENRNDFIVPYKVIIPIFNGNDTLWNWRIKKINLEIDFGPTQFNRPSKITHFDLKFDKEINYNKK